MDRHTAEAQLEGQDLTAVLEGALGSARELERALLQSDIPALIAARASGGGCCGGGCGCGAKVQVLVRPADVGRVRQVLEQSWLEAVRREGVGGETALVALRVEGQAEQALACPACGCAAPLVEGACSDCGLQLE